MPMMKTTTMAVFCQLTGTYSHFFRKGVQISVHSNTWTSTLLQSCFSNPLKLLSQRCCHRCPCFSASSATLNVTCDCITSGTELLNVKIKRHLQAKRFQHSYRNYTSQYTDDTHENNVSSNPTSDLDRINYLKCNDANTFLELQNTMVVYENFLSEDEERNLLNEIQPYMKRLRYERDHWDNAIHGYRETERSKWNDSNQKIIERVKNLAFPPDIAQLAYVHILDIEKSGYIKPHIDAVRFCGNTIAGLCLLSSCVMRLVHDEDKDKSADILLSRRSLYIMRDAARYKYTHEVLPEDKSVFKGKEVPRDRRISVIMRNEPQDE